MKYQNYLTNISKAERVYNIFLDNPYQIYSAKELDKLFKEKSMSSQISTILSRLYHKNQLLRTKKQLSDGYFYTLKNQEKLDKIYHNYLLPYDFANDTLLNLIEKNIFDKLQKNIFFELNELCSSEFLSKYNKLHLKQKRIDIF